MDKLRSLYVLRGGAALAVVFYHCFPRFSSPNDAVWFRFITGTSGYGYLGVPLFFVVSGFCIHLRTARTYLKTEEFELDAKDFWWRRFHRLYPPYLVMLVISMTFWIYLFSRSGSNVYPTHSSAWLGADLITHLLMLHGFHPSLDEGAGNAVYWTLAREEYLYLMYAIVLIYWRRTLGLRKILWLVAAIGVGSYLLTAGLVSADSPWRRLVVHSPLYLWIEWTLGMVAVEAHYGIIKLPNWCYSLLLVPVCLLAGYLCTTYAPAFEPIAWGMAFFLLLNNCVKREIEGRWPSWRVFSLLGAVGLFSYSLYLVHAVMIAAIFRLPGVRGNGPITSLALGLTIVVCCVAVGRLFYELIEKHFLNSRPRVSAPAQESLMAVEVAGD